ncbi:helix-turn-helix transcriptional regulator [Saccharopolyspora thermophila]|uniref:Helix-turn-helix transcriptional regulator n=1 Tax=Saccharopolyspora thermophila TaxID=89367 RepID=A0ABN1D5P9_9PSEU
MPTEGPIGERIRVYRRRRGLSQSALAGLVGRSESWLSQVERGIRSVDKLSILIDIARVLKVDVETLAGRPFSLAPNGAFELANLEAIRAALTAYPSLGQRRTPTLTVDEAQNLTAEAHQHYQAADYSRAARLLSHLLTGTDALVAETKNPQRHAALAAQSSAYVAAAKLITKVGDGHLAWLAADRAMTAAQHADDPLRMASAAYQLACAFLKLDRLDDAERIAVTTADNLTDTSPTGLSLRGALSLLATIIAARRNDRGEATERLARAQALADTLGEDGNHAWTAFGPTNVRIHAVSSAVELGDAAEAIARAETLDTTGLPPGLLSRRAQVHIDCAWAYAQRRQDAASVVNLMQAEAVAPQTLRYHIVVRELMREMLKRERRAATPGLRAMAERAGILQ